MDAVDVADLLEGLALDRYRLSHLAAPVVFEEAMKGDPVVHEIVSWAGSEPGGLVVGVIRQLGFEGIPFELILAGSLYDGSPALAEALMATEHAAALQAFLIRLAEPPVIGGVLPGMEQAHAQTADLCPVLIDSTRKMLAILSG